ncbi:hypothetical protein [Mucilaginibacter sp.]|uniref:hypothetical protein n=1 Tax=Mucilaginibacter sp. TaxID=1882438 RepID=UPI002609E084|nr:hypothetical protein [Mucilaginibacter sp.]MDB4919470.1 hypothetical protein [Mucilaginibacter sp.]
MAFSEQELIKIKEKLPRGYSKTLAQKFDITPKSIGRILKGTQNNEDVVLAALFLAEEHQQRISQAKEKLTPASL